MCPFEVSGVSFRGQRCVLSRPVVQMCPGVSSGPDVSRCVQWSRCVQVCPVVQICPGVSSGLDVSRCVQWSRCVQVCPVVQMCPGVSFEAGGPGVSFRGQRCVLSRPVVQMCPGVSSGPDVSRCVQWSRCVQVCPVVQICPGVSSGLDVSRCVQWSRCVQVCPVVQMCPGVSFEAGGPGVSFRGQRCVLSRPVVQIIAVRWLLNIPATCFCVSGSNLLRQLCVFPHCCRPISVSLTECGHRANQPKC